MKIDYRKEHVISYSEVDFKRDFDVLQVINFAQDMATEYYKTFGSDNPTIRVKNNAAWVLSKTKVDFFKVPVLGDKIKSRVYTTSVKPVRTVNENAIKNEDGENLIIVNQESCTIDIDSRKIRKLSTVEYPQDMEAEEALIKEPFRRLNEQFTDEDFVYETRVFASDIDFNRHVNNAVYVRYILNCFSTDFFEKVSTKEFEIHYINEALEGEFLSVFKKEFDDGFEFLILCEDREIVRAWMRFEECA